MRSTHPWRSKMEKSLSKKDVVYGIFLTFIVLITNSILSPIVLILASSTNTQIEELSTTDLFFFSLTAIFTFLIYAPGCLIDLIILIRTRKKNSFMPILLSLIVLSFGDFPVYLFQAFLDCREGIKFQNVVGNTIFLMLRFLFLYISWMIVYNHFYKSVISKQELRS